LKQGDALSLLLLNFVSEYAFIGVQVNQGGLKLNGTHQLLVYADNINILGWNVHVIGKNTVSLLIGSKEVGLELNDDKTKNTVMSW